MMRHEYFETLFEVAGSPTFPEEFAIITAYATTGEVWPDEENHAANESLRQLLEAKGVWLHPITGVSPSRDHAEPGFAVALGFDEACDAGLAFRQDAIYYVKAGQLFVSHCDPRRSLVLVGRFDERVDVK